MLHALFGLLALVGVVFAGEPVVLPGSEVRLPAQPGFVVEKRWVGVANPTTQATLAVNRMDAPAAVMIGAMGPEALAQQGVQIIEQRRVRIAGYRGTWMEGLQSGLFVWVVIVGDDDHTWLFKGTAPNVEAGRAVEQMVKGATWGEVAPVALAFVVEAPSGLKHAADLGGASMYTVDGTMTAVGKPLFVVAMSVRPLPPTEESARAMFGKVAGLEGVTVESVTPVVQSGRSGWDVRGQGVDVTTKAPMLVWQRVLFSADGLYLRCLGVAPLAEAEVWGPAYEAAAGTLRDAP